MGEAVFVKALFGADKDLTELNLCRAHLAKLRLSQAIELKHNEVFSYTPSRRRTLIVTDPTFGKRLHSSKKIFEDFGNFLRRTCDPTTRIFVLAPNDETLQPIGAAILSRFPLTHGGMEMFLYELKII